MQTDASEGIPAPELGRRAARTARGARPGTGPSLLAPGAARDPYRLYRILREEYPLTYDAPLGAWVVSRYADVTMALGDPRFTGFPHDNAPRGAPAPLGLCHGSIHRAPAGKRRRTLYGAVPRHTAERIERTAYVLARRIAGRQKADLVQEFCRWLPMGSAADVMAGPYPATDASPTRPPRTGTAPATPCTRYTGLRETALASFLANLLDAPDLLAALRVEPALAASAWTESLRRDPPVQLVLRRTVTEVALSGGTLPAGASVACLIGSAGRDPERFSSPDLFDPFRRDQGQELTGPAGCPAVVLGCLEAQQGLRALLDAMPRLRWADGFRPVGTGLLTRGPRALIVRPG